MPIDCDASLGVTANQNKTGEDYSTEASSNQRKIWLIVRKGERRELVEVSMNPDQQYASEMRASQIPRCPVNSLRTRSDATKPRHEALTATYAALRQRESKIPPRPVALPPVENDNKGLCDEIKTDERPTSRNENTKACIAMPLVQRCAKMDERIRQLHDRLDKMTKTFRQRNNALDRRLKEMRQRLHAADPALCSAASMILHMLMHLTGKRSVAYILFVCLVCGSRKSTGASQTEARRRCNGPKISHPSETISKAWKDISESCSVSFTAAFVCGLSWAKLEKEPRCSRQQTENAFDESRWSLDNQGYVENPDNDMYQNQNKALYQPQAVAHSAFQNCWWDSMNNRVNQLSPWETQNHTPYGMFDKAFGQNKDVFKTIVASPNLNDQKYTAPYRTSACHHMSTRTFSAEIELYKDDTIAAYDSTRQDSCGSDLSETLLEAVKPEVSQCSLSHLEAVADMALLDPVSSWKGDSVNFLHQWDSGQMDNGMQPMSSLTSIPEEDDQSNLAQSCLSIENPFFDSLLYDAWFEDDMNADIPIPHPSSNLVYGCQAIGSEAIQPTTSYASEEIKTKWISVNDFA